MRPQTGGARGGFTLIEILVALVLIGLLTSTLLPSVVNTVTRGEVNRVQEDLEALDGATKGFRIDVQRWPGDLEDMVSAPTAADSALTGTAYPGGLAMRWAGPYLEIGSVATGVPTGLGGTILSRMSQTTWNSQSFVTLKVLNVTQADAQALSLRVDGDTAVGHALDTAGKVRWRADTLIYLGAPVQ